MFLINSTACSFEVSISDAHCHVLVVQSCLPYLYPGTEKVSLPHHLPIPRRTHPSSAVSTLIYVDGEGEGEAGEGRKEGRPLPCCVRAFMRPNFVDGTAEGGTNFSLKYHHCTASIFRASSILSVRPSAVVSPLCQFGRRSGDVMRCPFPSLRPLGLLMETDKYMFLRVTKSRMLSRTILGC